MLFKPEHITAIIEGRKTQTRRLVKPGDFATHFILPDYDTGKTTIQSVQNYERLKWFWGKDYAVCSGRGKPGVVWNGPLIGTGGTWKECYPVELGNWVELRIRLLSIRQEPVQAISEADAIAEGCNGEASRLGYRHISDYHKTSFPGQTPIQQYAALWDRINPRKGTRWADNPDVWALTFEVVK